MARNKRKNKNIQKTITNQESPKGFTSLVEKLNHYRVLIDLFSAIGTVSLAIIAACMTWKYNGASNQLAKKELQIIEAQNTPIFRVSTSILETDPEEEYGSSFNNLCINLLDGQFLFNKNPSDKSAFLYIPEETYEKIYNVSFQYYFNDSFEKEDFFYSEVLNDFSIIEINNLKRKPIFKNILTEHGPRYSSDYTDFKVKVANWITECFYKRIETNDSIKSVKCINNASFINLNVYVERYVQIGDLNNCYKYVHINGMQSWIDDENYEGRFTVFSDELIECINLFIDSNLYDYFVREVYLVRIDFINYLGVYVEEYYLYDQYYNELTKIKKPIFQKQLRANGQELLYKEFWDDLQFNENDVYDIYNY